MVERTRRILFFGTPEFAAVGLRRLLDTPGITIVAVVTQPDRPAGRGNKLTPSPVKVVALEKGVPVIQPERIRKHEAAFITSVAPYGPFDLGVVIAFGQILPRAVLELPRRGCLNVHGSCLPRWRGAAPIQRAIMAGDLSTGVGLMGMEEGLDTGPVFAEATVPIGPHDTFGTVHDALATRGAELLAREITAIIDGSLPSTAQPATGVTYADKITAHDQLIAWNAPANAIAARIRALDPVPGAYTFVAGRRIKLFAAEPITPPQPLTPGEIAPAENTVIFGTSAGAVACHAVQPEGKRRMSAADWLRGTPLPPGTVATGDTRTPPGGVE
jgi:methionyl-tRNA formyltransferase